MRYCSEMKPAGPMVWVNDGVRLRDPGWSVYEAARQGAFNGSGSGWCVRCARKLGKPSDIAKLYPSRAAVVPDPRGVAFDRRDYDRRATPVKLEPLPAPMPWRKWVMAGVVYGMIMAASCWYLYHG